MPLTSPLLILCATREGQTKRIAAYLAAAFRAGGQVADLYDAATAPPTLDPREYRGVVIASPVHYGKHAPEIQAFVEAHRAELARVRTAFLSVSGSQGSAEDQSAPADARARASDEVRRTVESFFQATRWRPSIVLPVAGALQYSRYNPLIRFVIRIIAKRTGTNLDTKHDREYTDWNALDRFATEFARAVFEPIAAGGSSA